MVAMARKDMKELSVVIGNILHIFTTVKFTQVNTFVKTHQMYI